MRWNFVFSEMWQGLVRNLSMTVATVLTIAISLAGIGGAWLFHKQASSTHDYWFGKIEVSVYLKNEITDTEHDAIDTELHSLPQVKQVFYESKAQAYQRFKEEFKEQKALVENTTPDQLPESFRVKLKNPKQYNLVAQAVQNMPGVDQVVAESKTLKKLFSFFDGLVRGALFIALSILVVAILLIFNNVRIAAFTRRREVGIMRLVGASDFYIQAPFVLENVLCAVVGSLVAMAALFAGYWAFIDTSARQTFGSLINVLGYHAVLETFPIMLLVGVLLSGVTSALTLQRHLRV